MIEGNMLVEPLTLEHLKAQHADAMRNRAALTQRLRMLTLNGFVTERERDAQLDQAINLETDILLALVGYVPVSRKEALDKTIYLAAFTLSQRVAFDDETMKAFKGTLALYA